MGGTLYSAQYKFQVALEAVKGTKTISQLASETGVHPNQIGSWKRQLLEEGANVLSTNGTQQQPFLLKLAVTQHNTGFFETFLTEYDWQKYLFGILHFKDIGASF